MLKTKIKPLCVSGEVDRYPTMTPVGTSVQVSAMLIDLGADRYAAVMGPREADELEPRLQETTEARQPSYVKAGISAALG